MTKREIEKCENLMHEAIRYAKESKEELEKAMSEKDKTEREILHSKGVQHYGYAHGINPVSYTHLKVYLLEEWPEEDCHYFHKIIPSAAGFMHFVMDGNTIMAGEEYIKSNIRKIRQRSW